MSRREELKQERARDWLVSNCLWQMGFETRGSEWRCVWFTLTHTLLMWGERWWGRPWEQVTAAELSPTDTYQFLSRFKTKHTYPLSLGWNTDSEKVWLIKKPALNPVNSKRLFGCKEWNCGLNLSGWYVARLQSHACVWAGASGSMMPPNLTTFQ